MPVCQFIVTAADNPIFTEFPTTISSAIPVTVYKPCNLAGKYKAKVVSINYVDFLPTPNPSFGEANLEYTVTIDSNSWRFPTSGRRGITFSNRPTYAQLYPPDTSLSFEIYNTGAQMELLLSIQQTAVSGSPATSFDYWISTNFSYMILTLDLEKVPEMV